MEEKKLTDEEIVNALEICSIEVEVHDKDDCKECPYFIKKIDCVTGKRTEKDTLDLIQRQKAEIERLTEEVSTYILKAWFYYNKCKEYGIECFYDADLESQFKPAKEGKTITFPKFKGEVE